MTCAKLFAGLFGFAVAALLVASPKAHAVLITTTFTPGVGESARVAAAPTGGTANCCGVSDSSISTGRTGTGTYSSRSVLRFDDLATLDDSVTITSATLRLYRTSTPEANDGLQRLYLLSTPFSVAGLDPTCCDSDVDNGDLWRLADGVAGSGAGTPLTSFTAVAGYNSIDVTSVVQSWHANNWANAYGFGLVGVESVNMSNVTYAGAFSATPLELVVEYDAPVPEPNTLALMLIGGALALTKRGRNRELNVKLLTV